MLTLGLAVCPATTGRIQAAPAYTAAELASQLDYAPIGVLNNFGQVTGYFSPAGGYDFHAFLYSPDSGMADLGTLGGRTSWANSLNDVGQVAGYSFTSEERVRAFLYTSADGMINLGTLGGNNSQAVSLNDAGQVAGLISLPRRRQHAFLYSADGGMVDLGTLGGNNSQAVSLNNAGEVTGNSNTSEGGSHAFLYSVAGGMIDLGTLGGSTSEAAAINSAGQVTGYSYLDGDGSFHAFLYSADGGKIDLGTLGGTNSQAVSLNDSGQVIGSASVIGNAVHAFLYSTAGGMVDLGTLGGSTSYGRDINSAGRVTGSSYISGDGSLHAFVYSAEGGMVDLNAVTSGLTGYLNTALAINDRGMILAGGYRSDGSYYLYLLTPDASDLPATHWLGGIQGSLWSDTNWAGDVGGSLTSTTPTGADDITFSAIGGRNQNTTLDADFTIHSLTITAPADVTIGGENTLTIAGNAGTGIDVRSGAGLFTLDSDLVFAGGSDTITVGNNAEAIINGDISGDNGLVKQGDGMLVLGGDNIYAGATQVSAGVLAVRGSLSGGANITVTSQAMLVGTGFITMAVDQSVFINGTLSVENMNSSYGAYLSVTTSGAGALVMGAGGVIAVDLFEGAGQGGNMGLKGASDHLILAGRLDATAGGTLRIGNPNLMTGFKEGDQWQVMDLGDGHGSITGKLAVDTSALGLDSSLVGSFDQSTGIFSIVQGVNAPQIAADGLQTIATQNQALLSTIQNALGDINGRLFILRSGGGEDNEYSIGSAIDDGVVLGYGDGPEETPVAKKVPRSRQWEVYTTVNYANVSLSGIGTQAGVDAQTWSPSIGFERHFSRGFAAGFALSMLNTHQEYANNLGDLDIQGIALSAYGSYVRGPFWSDLLYSFGVLNLESNRNPGAGFPTANGDTHATSHSVQFNTGWNFRSQDRRFVTGPFIGVDYTHVAVDAFTETGGGLAALSYGARDFDSLITRIGWSASKKFVTNFGAVTPQFRLSYERQNMSNNNATSASLVNLPFTATSQAQSPGQDYVVAGTGVHFAFSESFSLMVNYQVHLFREDMQAHFGSVRFSYQF